MLLNVVAWARAGEDAGMRTVDVASCGIPKAGVGVGDVASLAVPNHAYFGAVLNLLCSPQGRRTSRAGSVPMKTRRAKLPSGAPFFPATCLPFHPKPSICR